MKTALLLCGVIPENYHKYYDSIYKTTIEPFNSDVFISTWASDKINDVFALYKPKLCRVEDFNGFPIKSRLNNFLYFLKSINYNGDKNYMLNSTYPMFYKIYDVNNLKKENEETENIIYDLVIRCRFDLSFDRRLDIMTRTPYVKDEISKDELEDLDNIYLRMDGGDVVLRVPDNFAFGDSKNIDKYSNALLNFKEILTSNYLDNEYILCKNLLNNKVNLKHTKTTYDIKHYDK